VAEVIPLVGPAPPSSILRVSGSKCRQMIQRTMLHHFPSSILCLFSRRNLRRAKSNTKHIPRGLHFQFTYIMAPHDCTTPCKLEAQGVSRTLIERYVFCRLGGPRYCATSPQMLRSGQLRVPRRCGSLFAPDPVHRPSRRRQKPLPRICSPSRRILDHSAGFSHRGANPLSHLLLRHLGILRGAPRGLSRTS